MSERTYEITPPCQWCGVHMYRHPIVGWACYCLTCDRAEPEVS